MRLLLTGNFTLEPFGARLAEHDTRCAPFGSYRAVLSGQQPELLSDREAVVILLDGYELAIENELNLERIAQSAVEYAELLSSFAQSNPHLLVFGSTIKLPSAWPQSFGALLASQSPRHIEYECHSALAETSRRLSNFYVLDMENLIRHRGETSTYNDGMRYFARYGFTPAFTQALAQNLRQLLNAALMQGKKVLAVDFDDTLWGGILGETGPLGVDLSQEGIGRAFRHFQMAIKNLVQRGVILVGLSKNNSEDVEELFAKNDMMILKKEDFALLYANWESKPQNLCKAAETLNLGLDSFVFIDNSPFERGAIKEMCPEVTVPDVPEAADARPRWLVEDIIPAFFPSYRVTREDFAKTEQYKANALRTELKGQMPIEDYIRSLQISLEFRVNDPGDAVRISQMTQKTNQFNLTTRRYTVADIERMMRSGQHDVVGMRYEDRYGKEGLVSLGILDIEAASIDSFLMSCRVIGRGVEERLLDEIEKRAREHGIAELKAFFLPTAKNSVSKGFLEKNGFMPILSKEVNEQQYRKKIA